jgi:hypothetical protein
LCFHFFFFFFFMSFLFPPYLSNDSLIIKSVLLSLHVFKYFLQFLLLLISSFITLWSDDI